MSLFGKHKDNTSVIKTPTEFYLECIKAYHEAAAKLEVVQKDQIIIPELMPVGEKVALAFLQNQRYLDLCKDDAEKYYQMIIFLSIHAGMAVATQWDLNKNDIQKHLGMIINDPVQIGQELIKQYFSNVIPDSNGMILCVAIFIAWKKLHDPYWKLSDPRKYTLLSMAAAFQLGVTMMLEKYGY